MTRGRRISDLIGQPKEELREIAKRAKELGEEMDNAWRDRVASRVQLEKPKNGVRYEIDDIYDHPAIESIYCYYLLQNYREVFLGIKLYGDFEFFRDMAIYLRHRYNNETLKQKTYEFFIDLYYN